MAGFFHGDPYFPNGGNAGWIEEEPVQQVAADPVEDAPAAEEPENEPEEDPEEGEDDDEDMEGGDPYGDEDEESDEEEEEIIDPRFPIQGRDEPLPPPYHQNDTPAWVTEFRRWSRDQGQLSPFVMSRAFQNVNEGTPADRALPVMVRRMSRLDEQARATTSQLYDVGAATQVNTARFQQLDADHNLYRGIVYSLQQELNIAQAETRELRERMSGFEQRILAAERRADEAVNHTRELRNRVATYYGL